jgi:hypothetical protein
MLNRNNGALFYAIRNAVLLHKKALYQKEAVNENCNKRDSKEKYYI